MTPNANEIARRARQAEARVRDILEHEPPLTEGDRTMLERVQSLLGTIVVDAERLADVLRDLA